MMEVEKRAQLVEDLDKCEAIAQEIYIRVLVDDIVKNPMARESSEAVLVHERKLALASYWAAEQFVRAGRYFRDGWFKRFGLEPEESLVKDDVP